MIGRTATTRWVIGATLAAIAVGRACAGAPESATPALTVHHGGGAAPAIADHVAHLIEAADEACFVRGSDAEALSQWAQFQHWTPAPAQELGTGANDFATLIAGWTYETPFASFAIVQSRLNAPHDGYVCSLTTKLASAEQHVEVRAAFQRKFGATTSAEPERGESHSDQFWIERDLGPPVKATILHTPATSSLTIRMIHGKTRPLRS